MRAAKAQMGLEKILFIDLGKNMLAYWLAAKACGAKVVAIADPKLARTRKRYRGLQIIDDETARALEFDAAVVSNLSPVHAQRRGEQWRLLTDRPVLDLLSVEDSISAAGRC
jgi:hypothetical protein